MCAGTCNDTSCLASPGHKPWPSGLSPHGLVLSYFLFCLCETMGGFAAMVLTQKCLHTRIILSVCKLLIVWVVSVLFGGWWWWVVGGGTLDCLFQSGPFWVSLFFFNDHLLYSSFCWWFHHHPSSFQLIPWPLLLPPNSNLDLFCSVSDKKLGSPKPVPPPSPRGSNPNLRVWHWSQLLIKKRKKGLSPRRELRGLRLLLVPKHFETKLTQQSPVPPSRNRRYLLNVCRLTAAICCSCRLETVWLSQACSRHGKLSKPHSTFIYIYRRSINRAKV